MHSDDKHDDAPAEATGLRGMREAMRESAQILKSTAPADDNRAEVDLARLYRIQDLQAETYRLQEALQEAVRQGDENFYRVLDLRDDVRILQEEVRDRDSRINALSSERDAAHALALTTGAELAQWQAYASGLRGVVGDVLSSDSWRFTWVLRAISATLRGRKSTGPALPDAPASRGIGHDGG